MKDGTYTLIMFTTAVFFSSFSAYIQNKSFGIESERREIIKEWSCWREREERGGREGGREGERERETHMHDIEQSKKVSVRGHSWVSTASLRL